MKCVNIMGILIDSRVEEVPEVQNVLTQYGNIIRARLGLHDTNPYDNSEEGLIILRLCGKQEEIEELENKLKSINGVKVQRMSL